MAIATVYSNAEDWYAYAESVFGPWSLDTITVNTGTTSGAVGLLTDGSTYWITYQTFLSFDTSTVPAGTDSSLALNLYRASSSGSYTLEWLDYSWPSASSGAMRNPVELGALTQLGSGSGGAGYDSLTSALSSVPRSASWRTMVATQDNRLNTGLTSNNRYELYLSEQAGTTNDPYLTWTYTTTTTHATTGALTGPGSAIVGSAAHKALHATSGALAGPGATVAGAAALNKLHTATGALTGQGATATGSSMRFKAHAVVGALAGQGSIITGASRRAPNLTASGVLIGPSSVIAGTAQHVPRHAASGNLVAGSVTVARDSRWFHSFWQDFAS